MATRAASVGIRTGVGEGAPTASAGGSDSANEALVMLLQACANRNRDAFSTLYERTSPKLFAVALRMLKRQDWAEEVLQDCFINIWNNAGSYSHTLSAPMTWMTSIVRNRCLDWLRRPNLEVSAELDEENGESWIDRIASEEPGPLALLEQSSDARALSQCLGVLEVKQRRAIMLAFYEGMSHSELAAHLGQPLGTVKTWIRRGLERLKDCLG